MSSFILFCVLYTKQLKLQFFFSVAVSINKLNEAVCKAVYVVVSVHNKKAKIKSAHVSATRCPLEGLGEAGIKHV